jgi:hypothetical protein
MPVRFLTPNPADNATLTPSSEKVGFPVENVQDKRLSQRWITGNDIITIDDCETADFNQNNAPNETLDTTNFKEGSASLNIGKSGGGGTGEYWKTESGTVDLTDKRAGLWLYVKDKTEFTNIQIWFGSSGANYFYKNFTPGQLTDLDADGTPWNDLVSISGEPLQDWLSVGSPDITAIDEIRIRISTTLPTDTIALGNLKMDYWRAEYLITEYIEFDFGSAQSVIAGVIDGHNLDGTETDIKLDSSTDAISWTNRATFTYNANAMAVFISSVSSRYWRIIFTKAIATDEREIGRVFVGTYVQPTRGMQLSWRRTRTDSGQSKRAFSGTQYADIRNKWWEVDFKLKHEPDATLTTLRDALVELGITEPLFLALEPISNPNAPYTLYGRFSRPWSESEPLNDVFDVSFKFAEDL